MSIYFNSNTLEESVDLTILSNNLCQLMDSRSIDSALLSSQTEIGVTTINKLRRGIGNPTYSTLVTLAAFFNVLVSQLTEVDLSKNVPNQEKLSNIHLLSLSDFKDFINQIKTPRESVVVAITSNPDSCVAIKITTNAMSPFFEKGSIFILDRNINPQDGDIVLVDFNEQNLCFRRVFIQGNSYFFRPVADTLAESFVKGDNFIIHGVVVSAIQNFHSS
ncbi:MAG: hypothetical protein H0U73_08295 [Tatlockia sp.]|nr:hypothetical protein [Tatlockia sp.]